MDQTIENGIGQGGIGEAGMPVLQRDLGGHQGRSPAVAVVDDLQQIPSLAGGQGIPQPVVEDEKRQPGQGV